MPSLYLASSMNVWTIVAIVLVVILVILAILYFVGSRLQKKQVSTQKAMEAMSMTLQMLVIDKAKLKISESGLIKQAQDGIPAYLKWRKWPIVKARIIKANIAGGAQIMSFICDPKVFKIMPVKTEVKVAVSGIYITKLISAKGIDLTKINKK